MRESLTAVHRVPWRFMLRGTGNRTTDIWWIESHGAQGRDRTTDTAIFSRMLYQLSYLGISRRGAGSAGL